MILKVFVFSSFLHAKSGTKNIHGVMGRVIYHMKDNLKLQKSILIVAKNTFQSFDLV